MIENEPLTFDGRMVSGPSTADLLIRDDEDVLVTARRRKNADSEWTVRGYVVYGDDIEFQGLDARRADLAAIFVEAFDGADLRMDQYQYSTVRPVGDGIPAVVAVDGRPAIAAWCLVRGDDRDEIADLMDVDRRTITDYLSRFRRRGTGLPDVSDLPSVGDHVQEVPAKFLHPAGRQRAVTDGGIEERDRYRSLELKYLIQDPLLGPERVERELPLDDLLEDGRIRLWSDPSGWEGIEYDEDADVAYYVNVGKIAGEVQRDELSPEEVAERIQGHIEDPEAGPPGRFVRGATPP